MTLPGFPDPMEAGDDDLVVATVDDAIERDGEMLVISGIEISLLSPVAASAVSIAGSSGVTVTRLAELLEEEFGRPDGVTAAVAMRQILAALMERGVVDVRSGDGSEH